MEAGAEGRVRDGNGRGNLEGLRIVGLCVGAAVLYGIVHDQITARVCIEYFTVFHPRLIAEESPTAQGLFWGIFATWWAGVLLGIPLALAARKGRWPPLAAGDLLRPIGVLLLVMGATAFAAGLLGYQIAERGVEPTWLATMQSEFPAVAAPGRWPRFVADLFAHNASYNVGFGGGVVVIVGAILRRRRLALQSSFGRPDSGSQSRT